MIVEYRLNEETGWTSNVYVDWPDGVCYLVANQFGVVGAVIVMGGGPDDGWYEAYQCAVDEIAHDVDEEQFDADDIRMMVDDGLAQYRGSGVPSQRNRRSHLADTEFLEVIRCQSPFRINPYSIAAHGR